MVRQLDRDFPGGAGERNRTADLRITSALLYLLSYTSPWSQANELTRHYTHAVLDS